MYAQNQDAVTSRFYDYLSEPVEGDGVIQFRLLYSGRLLMASKTKTRADMKHSMRKQFHPQLRRLWTHNPSLREMTKRYGLEVEYNRPDGRYNDIDGPSAIHSEWGTSYLADKWQRCGFRFVPLVTDALALRCSLDILFLRPEDDGLLINSGDLDGRLKTLFDALRMPKSLDETGNEGPGDDEDPFYCLLEDDRLISSVSVTADQLLLLPESRSLSANDVFLVIDVKLKLVEKQKSSFDWVFD